MQIENIPIKQIKPYKANAKKHPPEQVEHIANSIREFGWQQPIVIDKDGVVVIGHGRLLAAKKLGMKEVPCVRAEGLTDEQIKALRLADNKTNESEWDIKLLAEDMGGIFDIDMSQFGFETLLDEDEPTEVVEDDVPEEAPPRAKLGDIWQLGEHRLMCGDSTDAESVGRLMDGEKADMVFTDPPYNMSDNLWGFVSDEMKKRLDKIVNFDPSTIAHIFLAVETDQYYIFTSKDLIPQYLKIFEGFGFNILVWCKDNPTPMTNNTFLPDVEYLLYFYRNGRIWNNGLDVSLYKKYYNSNKMEGRKEAGNVHPTIKPVKIIADKVQICSSNRGIVLDLFGGSGSTLIACEQLHRKCYMMELDPHYCDVIIQRWENFTGRKAELINGTTC